MSRLTKLSRMVAVAGAMSIAVIACGPDYERMEISGTVQDDFQGNISLQHLTVHEGMIVKSHLVAWDDDDDKMPLVVRSEDTNVIEVASVISDRDFAFIGKKEGTTRITFTADGDVVLIVEAEVRKQPPLPE